MPAKTSKKKDTVLYLKVMLEPLQKKEFKPKIININQARK